MPNGTGSYPRTGTSLPPLAHGYKEPLDWEIQTFNYQIQSFRADVETFTRLEEGARKDQKAPADPIPGVFPPTPLPPA